MIESRSSHDAMEFSVVLSLSPASEGARASAPGDPIIRLSATPSCHWIISGSGLEGKASLGNLWGK